MQAERSYYRLQSVVEFAPRYSEEPCNFSLRHGNVPVSPMDNLHIAAPIKDAALILRAGLCF